MKIAHTPKEVQHLIDLVNKEFDCNVKDKNRYADNVYARMTFGSIMRDKGSSYQSIGKHLDRNHATIIHYIKNMETYRKTDKVFDRRYRMVRDKHLIEYGPEYDAPEYSPEKYSKLINEVISLNKEKKELHLEIERISLENKNYAAPASRVQELIDIVTQRTRSGREEETANNLNRWYNGLQY